MRSLLLLALVSLAIAQEKPEIYPQLGHADSINALAFSPDGHTLVSASSDHTLKLWDPATGRELHTLSGHTDQASSVAFSSNGRTILSGSWDGTIRFWEAAAATLLRTILAAEKPVNSVALSPDGRIALSGSADNTAQLWDTSTGRLLHTLRHDDSVESVAFSPDGRRALSGSDDGEMKLWDVATGRLLHTTDTFENLKSVAFSPDGKTALSAGDKFLSLWDPLTGRELLAFPPMEKDLHAAVFSPDGRTILSGAIDGMTLWSVATGKPLRTYATTAESIAFSPDGRTAASADQVGEATLWDVASGRELRRLTGDTSWVDGVALSPDGRTVIFSNLGDLELWDLTAGAKLRSFSGHGGYISCVAFSPDGRTVLSGSSDQTVRLWDISTGVERFRFSGPAGLVRSVAFSPDGLLALSGGDYGSLWLWDLTTGQAVRTFKGKLNGVYSVAFSPDGRQALSGENDAVNLWNVADGKLIRSFSGASGLIESVAFSPDGRTALSTNGDADLTLWDVATGKPLQTFTGHTNLVRAVAFSPDGKTALSGSEDRTLRLWDIATGATLRVWKGHVGNVTAAVFARDGQRILSSSADGSVRLWSPASEAELLQLISFNDDEWVAITPEGYYNASSQGDQHLNARFGDKVYGIDQWRSTFYRPAVVAATYRLGDSHTAIADTLGSAPRSVMIEPPFVVLKTPDEGARLNSLATEIAFYIEDRRQPIQSVKVTVNGSTAAPGNIPTGQKQLNLRVPLTLEPGDNVIEVAANNGVSEGRASVHVTAAPPASTNSAQLLPNLWILGIAVNKYDSPGIPQLSYAVADVRGIAAAFESQKGRLFNEVHTLILADDAPLKPTRENIVDNLGFLAKAGQHDVALLFVSGHGENDDLGNYYFLPSDAALLDDGKFRPSRAVRWSELKQVLDIPAHKLVLIDTCHSEGVGGRRSGETSRGTIKPVNETLVKGLQDFGAVVFASSKGDELSQESAEWGHGAFTFAILQGLAGEADLLHTGVITMKELDTYVSAKVPAITKPAQHPITDTPNGYTDFPVAKLK
jgi:WD40 repeat protein